LISKVRVSQKPVMIPLQPIQFNLSNRHELEIMEEIGKYEKLAYELYSDILEGLKKTDLKGLLHDEKDTDSFMSSLVQLISDEKNHISLTGEPAIGLRIQRIS